MYDSLVRAITAHWKAHDSKYPRKVVLTPDHLTELNESRRLGRLALGEAQKVTDPTFLGVHLAEDPNTPGMLIAIDGSEVAVAAS